MLRKTDQAQTSLHPLVLRYLNTIGFSLTNAAISLEVVESIMTKHGHTFAATSLPANLSDPVRLDFSSLAEYLIENRYGYCFHHNIVAFEVLKQLGFYVEILAANIRKPPNFTEANILATHAVILLTFQNKRYLLDPGWGIAALQPLLIDGADTPQAGYRVTKVSNDKYGLVGNVNSHDRVRYEFSCTPVNIHDFELALNNVMSPDHAFYKMFFYEQKKRNGQIHYIFNRQYKCIDAKGVKVTEFSFGYPAKNLLQTKFSMDASKAARIETDSYPNPQIKKMMTGYELPEKASRKIYGFLSGSEKRQGQLVATKWNPNQKHEVAALKKNKF